MCAPVVIRIKMLEATGGACDGVQKVCEETFVIRWHVVRRVDVCDIVDRHGDVPVWM